MGAWTTLHISPSFCLSLLRLSVLSFVHLPGIVLQVSAYDPKVWPFATVYRLQVCPGNFRVWVVIDVGFSLFLDPGRKKKKKPEDKQAKVKSFQELTHMTIHTYNRSQSTFTSAFSRSFHTHSSLYCGWMHPAEKMRVTFIRDTEPESKYGPFSFSPMISNGRVEGGLYLPIKCVFKVSFHLAGNCISFVGLWEAGLQRRFRFRTGKSKRAGGK